VNVPRSKIIEEGRSTLLEAEFEQRGVVSEAGTNCLKEFLSEVPPQQFTSPLKLADIPWLFTTETFCRIVIQQWRPS